jgi:hypothetical protein
MPPKGTPGMETPAKGKKETTIFKTYESQARLLAAVVASLDGVRFDYKSKFCVSFPRNFHRSPLPSSRLVASGHWPGHF